ncbi:hypothetical protein SAMN06295888_14511 [Desulfonatronum zhilinae]|nr:hypothetical protein SAMN06295888_14511 [Desulfonatronum zhilinae]
MTQTLELEDHIKSLRRLRDMAVVSRKIGPAITAEVAIGRALLGMRVVEDGQPRSVYQLSDQELLEIASGGREERA